MKKHTSLQTHKHTHTEHYQPPLSAGLGRGDLLYLLHELQNVLKAALCIIVSLKLAADFSHDPVLLLVPLDVLG